jgi:hypothetical protein
VLLRPLRKGVNAPSNKTSLIVYAMCASSAYALDIHRINLGGMRLHHPESTIVMATCGEHSLPEDIFDMPDAVLQARCASSRGYDSGLWQQALRYAMRVIDWATLRTIYLINDSVFGPLYRMTTKPGMTVAAVWQGHIASSAVHAYSREVLRSATFIDYWNGTEFRCNKIGSMVLLEHDLYDRYAAAGWGCSTYTNSIDEFQQPGLSSARHPLPFYKHKNNGYLPRLHAVQGRAALETFALQISNSNNSTSSRMGKNMVPCSVKDIAGGKTGGRTGGKTGGKTGVRM